MPRHNPERSEFKGRSYTKGGKLIRTLKEDQMDEDMDMTQIHEDDAYEMDGPGLDDEDFDSDEEGDEDFDDDDYDDSMDGDHESALASAGFGTDEDYGGSCYGDDDF